MVLERILVAVDALNDRDAAFERALPLARSAGAELYVLYGVPVAQRFSFGAAERLARMADLRRRAEAAGVPVRTVEQHGDPAELIELHAAAREVDLVVLGGQRRRGWRSGSPVAERVIRRIGVPTLVVPSGAADAPVQAFRNILVALDLSPASKTVLSGAMALISDRPAQLTVLHAVKGVDAPNVRRWTPSMLPEYPRHVLHDARRSLETTVSELAVSAGTRIEVSAGSPAAAILGRAADIDADLVVVGRSRGFTMLGSTALRVLRKHARALLIVPNGAPRTQRVDRPLAA